MSRASERRKSKDSNAGSGAYWMDTYGDMVTLLLTFFVLLFSFSTIDAEKWKSIVGAFSGTASVSVTVLDPEMVMENPIEVLKPPKPMTIYIIEKTAIKIRGNMSSL